jgi:hypothetical protein
MTGSGLLVEPRAGWARPTLTVNDDADDARSERLAARMRARWTARQQLVALLGQVYRDTTMLPLPGGGVLGPARTAEGVVLKWWLWAPSRRVLIDVFRRPPPMADLQARDAFARAEGLRYGVVMPDRRFTVETLKAWLEAA